MLSRLASTSCSSFHCVDLQSYGGAVGDFCFYCPFRVRSEMEICLILLLFPTFDAGFFCFSILPEVSLWAQECLSWASWIVPLAHSFPLLSRRCHLKFRIARAFLKFSLGGGLQHSQLQQLPLICHGWTDNLLSFDNYHSWSICTAEDASNHILDHDYNFLRVVQSRSKGTFPFFFWRIAFLQNCLFEPGSSIDFLRPSLSLPLKRTFSAFWAQACWRPRATIFAFLVCSFRRVHCNCSLERSFEKSTCSSVDARGCQSPYSLISGSFSATFSEQCQIHTVSKRSSWV